MGGHLTRDGPDLLACLHRAGARHDGEIDVADDDVPDLDSAQ
jgi:hypothetical protein